MQNPVLDAQVSRLVEENKEMKEKISELEKKIEQNHRAETHDLKEIFVSIKEFNEKILWITARKEWIDNIIEKIKKILPI